MSRHGFTLLELMLVVTIIGLLAAGFLVSSSNLRQKSRDDKRKADLLAIQSALEVYFAQNKRYPSNCAAGFLGFFSWAGVTSQSKPYPPPAGNPGWSTAAQASIMWPGRSRWIHDVPLNIGSPNSCVLLVGAVPFTSQYISALPVDPINSGQYIYRYKTNSQFSNVATQYVLDAKLERDSDSMQNDNGRCNGPNPNQSRYELFSGSPQSWWPPC